MANRSRAVPGNAPGAFFVDSTCIDCDVCRLLAPAVFGSGRDTSIVAHQPTTFESHREAARALLSCPVGAIGSDATIDVRSARADFPLKIADSVYFCGFSSPDSYGATSYFLVHPEGNWMIDSPRYSPHLVDAFRSMGGVQRIFLTHRDDVADADRYAAAFGAKRYIHAEERGAQPGAECVFEGDKPVPVAHEITIVPTPGHTRGHAVMHVANRYLFSGDHVWWSRTKHQLSASRSVCWYSWSHQTESMVRVSELSFEWVFPGHGEWIHLSPAEKSGQFLDLIRRMRS